MGRLWTAKQLELMNISSALEHHETAWDRGLTGAAGFEPANAGTKSRRDSQICAIAAAEREFIHIRDSNTYDVGAERITGVYSVFTNRGPR